MKIIATNKKAYHDFEILEKYEAGLVLEGSEVKAIRAGRVNLKDSFVKFVKGEPYVFGMHISHLDSANPHFRPDEKRPRKLLLHKKQIDKLLGKTSEKGYTLVPLRLYFNNKNIAKLEIALAKGKSLHDKRESLKKKIMDREARAAMKDYR
ncbi:MAG: SsrA-binding protein [Epsilonproteobacteria bacterium]|nr:SsrA-binding protein [Campylobacterota bacterium]NPA64348.1 SsrA-binding protein SmpB [Campylobacterota bacterium]